MSPARFRDQLQGKEVQNVCFHCFSVAMVKHHDHGSLEEGGFIWADGSTETRPSCREKHGSRAGSRESHREVEQGLKLSKTAPSDGPPPSKAVPPKALKTAPTGNQVFKCSGLQGTFPSSHHNVQYRRDAFWVALSQLQLVQRVLGSQTQGASHALWMAALPWSGRAPFPPQPPSTPTMGRGC